MSSPSSRPRRPWLAAPLVAALALAGCGREGAGGPDIPADAPPAEPAVPAPAPDTGSPPGDDPAAPPATPEAVGPAATLEEAAARQIGPDDGFAALDPATGEVHALVNPEVVVRGLYPPGSTFKLLVAYALLDDGLIGPHDEVDCGGSHSVDGTLYPCSLRAGHGPVDLVRGLAHSCNVFFYRQGARLGLDGVRGVVDTFRLLEPTGFDPGEPAGRFPDTLPAGEQFLLAAGNVNSLQVTPLNMLVAFGGLVGDGQCRRPWRGDRPRGSTRASLPALFEYQALLMDGLEGAVQYGTATAAAVPGETVLGKTGTMMRPDEPTAVVNWFLGYLVERRLVAVVIQTRAEGIEPAAAAFGRIFDSFPRDASGESADDIDGPPSTPPRTRRPR